MINCYSATTLIHRPESKDNLVLGATRRNTNDWGLPGGKVDFGESAWDCAIRETIEETGVRPFLYPLPMLGNYHPETPDRYCATYYATAYSGTPETREEGIRVEWVLESALEKSLFGKHNTTVFAWARSGFNKVVPDIPVITLSDRGQLVYAVMRSRVDRDTGAGRAVVVSLTSVVDPENTYASTTIQEVSRGMWVLTGLWLTDTTTQAGIRSTHEAVRLAAGLGATVVVSPEPTHMRDIPILLKNGFVIAGGVYTLQLQQCGPELVLG